MKNFKQVTALLMTLVLILAMSGNCPVRSVQAATSDLDNPTVFTFTDEGITVSGAESSSYKIEGTDLTINGAGTYKVTGTCSDGQVKVKKGTTGVFLIVNNLNLTSADTAPMLFNSSTEVELILQGTSSLADTVHNNDETYPDNTKAENATLKSKASSTLTISGDGTLNITANGKNALKANGSLVINGGILNITSVDDGINNESSVVINGGTITIDSEGDGIKSEADDAPVGSVVINGGSVTIDTMGDGIQATEILKITGGVVKITAYGGYNATYDKDDDTYPSAKGLKASGSYEVTDETTGTVTEVDATECDILITGGTIDVNSADDAIHANRNTTIVGGNITVKSGDDGVHADYITTIGKYGAADDSLMLNIEYAYEGMEGAVVNLQGGTTRIFATDDGVNAANSDLTNYDFQLNIAGGNHFISCSKGDGVDSNNSFTVYGGTTVVLASSGEGEGNPLDCDGNFNLYGGEIIGIGTNNGMQSATVKSGTYVTFGSSRTSSSGGGRPGGFGGGSSSGSTSTGNVSIKATNTVSVADSFSNTVLSTTAEWINNPSNYTSNYVVYVSSALTSGSTYSLLVNGSSVATATVTGSQATNVPTYTPVEVEEPSASEAPASSETPVVTETPTVSETPVVTETPTVSETPVVTETPTVSETPVVTETPTVSETPTITETPVSSVTPVISEQPADTDTPVVSEEPTTSNSPITSETPTIIPTTTPTETNILGDVDVDGDVDLTDAQLTLKAALKIIDTVELNRADMDSDKAITLSDAQTILKKALKIIP